MPMPPARNTAGRAASSSSTISPLGPSILTAVPMGAVFRTRLNAVSRMRVASSERANSGKGVGGFVTLSRIVVPVEFSGFFALGKLVRAIAERLVLRQTTATDVLCLAAADELVRRG